MMRHTAHESEMNDQGSPGGPTSAPLTYRRHLLRSPISAFVEFFWACDGETVPLVKERVVPTGTMQVIINLGDDELRVYDRQDHRHSTGFGRSLVSGAHSRFVVIDTASQASTVGIHFKPGGAYPPLTRAIRTHR